MPELPEVETVKRGLIKSVKGRTFKDVKIIHKNIVEGSEQAFINALKNKKIIDIKRKAKYLIFELSGKENLLGHLGMEGKFIPGDSIKNKSKYLRVLFTFKDGSILNFDDSRCFGWLAIRDKKDYLTTLPLSKIGVEPIDPKINIDEVYKEIHKSHRTIKETLLDQTIVAGLGNIYVDETLYRANISPLSKANLLSKSDVANILKHAKDVLLMAIKHNGTTVFSFHWDKGHSGEFQKFLKVYGKKGKPCESCGTPLVKIKIGGRGTTYCPKCQKLKTDKYVLGITGPVSVGKSTTLNTLKKLGYLTYSADEAVNKLYQDKKIQSQLKNIFNTYKKDEIRKIVSNNPNKLKKLESILHPLVKKDIQNFIDTHKGYLAIEVPLLFQVGFDSMMDETLLILSSQNKTLIKNRGKKANAQLNVNELVNFNHYKNKATYVISNNKSLNNFVNEVKRISKL
ncbi:MAG: DNA-formamidopyrimidine glycosylase [Bacilli bacterium]|nr:DNA-formamidopyrimidine glycosylase [Bacilli bacterium]